MTRPSASRAASGIAVVLALIGPRAVEAQDRPAHPNIVMILLDTLRTDYLGLEGASPDPAPFLSELAAEATVFDNAFSSSSWTPPAIGSLFTGLYPTEHGMHLGLVPVRHGDLPLLQDRFRIPPERMRLIWADASRERTAIHVMDDGIKTLAEVTKANGYTTAAVVSNPHVSAKTGLSQGFDTYLPEDFEQAAPRGPIDADQLFAMIQEVAPTLRSAEPFFLYAHFLDPHAPYKPREPHYESSSDELEDARRRYRSEIRFMDDYVRRTVDLLKTDRDTITIIVSDHGEEFEDHGGREHGFTLYNELNRILLMVHAPTLGVPARRVETNVSIVDVYPTLLEWLGLNDDSRVHGVSLLPLVRDASSNEVPPELSSRTLFAHRISIEPDPQFELWAAISGSWKLIETGPENSPPLLFNLDSDPGERSNVAADNPDTVDRLRDALGPIRRSQQYQFNLTPVEFEPAVKELLESLGYIE